jgi:hypothetical protein
VNMVRKILILFFKSGEFSLTGSGSELPDMMRTVAASVQEPVRKTTPQRPTAADSPAGTSAARVTH